MAIFSTLKKNVYKMRLEPKKNKMKKEYGCVHLSPNKQINSW